MKIEKTCKNEIIVCESTNIEHIYIKRYYDLAGNFRHLKKINIGTNRIGKRYRVNVKDAFEYLICNEGYRFITD